VTQERAAERPRRRYDSTLRQERAAQTKERIIDAGAALVHGYSSWNWRKLTIRAVAERAGVHERTVYRHFDSEESLRAAVVARLEHEAGIHPDDVSLDDLRGHVTALFDYLSTFSSSTEPPIDASLADEDRRRKAGLVAAVQAATPSWSDDDRTLVAALIDVLASVAAYRRLVSAWQLDSAEATRAVGWLLELMTTAVQRDEPPPPPGRRR
jgi:AcrR family transcriptional regulator